MSQANGSSLLDENNIAERNLLTRVPILVINAHNRCNCRCVMCDIWKITEARPLRAADLEPHIASFRALGVRWIVFTGGEPLMNPELPLLAAMLRAESVRLTLLSTGLLLERHAAEVAESFDEVIVSLDGPSEVHDRIRRVPGAFSRLQSGIASLRARVPSFPICARTTVQKANHMNLRETVETAKSLGVRSISFLAADLTSQAFNRELVWPVARQSEIALSAEELAGLDSEIEALIFDYGAEIDSGFIAESPTKLRKITRHFRSHLGLATPVSPQCNAPWVSAVIETDGTVRPCFFHPPIGNLHRGGFAEIINGEEALRFRSGLDVPTNPICTRCVCSLHFAG